MTVKRAVEVLLRRVEWLETKTKDPRNAGLHWYHSELAAQKMAIRNLELMDAEQKTRVFQSIRADKEAAQPVLALAD